MGWGATHAAGETQSVLDTRQVAITKAEVGKER
jgi:hypothetical protein